jgi:toxin-antitoxin system PIN domain toxin
MILLDANLLIYAYDQSSPFQGASRAWLERVIATEPVIGLPWITILAFLRITTHPALPGCQSFELATGIIDDWLALPNVRVVGPEANYWATLKRTATEAQARGAFVTDAALAALAIETGATLCSHDKGFRRFTGLRLLDPLQP